MARKTVTVGTKLMTKQDLYIDGNKIITAGKPYPVIGHVKPDGNEYVQIINDLNMHHSFSRYMIDLYFTTDLVLTAHTDVVIDGRRCVTSGKHYPIKSTTPSGKYISVIDDNSIPHWFEVANLKDTFTTIVNN